MIARSRKATVLAGILTLSLIAAACGDDSSGASDTTAADSATTSAAGTATTAAGAATTAGSTATTEAAMKLAAKLGASGATFPKAFYEEAIDAFTADNPDVTIDYAGGGSGKGRQDLADQLVDWAGTDGVIKAEDKAKFKGGEVLYFPTVVAPITVSFNVSGVDKLNLSPDTIAGIFSGAITKWDHAAIAADNSGVKLPSTNVTVVHRSDSSGTTENFTKFLDAASGATGSGVWKLGKGSTVEWPANTQGAEGNAGVANLVKTTDGAIGYVDLSDAKASGLKFASVKNKAGKFVEPTLEATSAAAAGATVAADLTFFAGWAEGDAAYPIAAQTWIIAYKNQTDKAKGEATKAFIKYLLTDGQAAAEDIDFAPLPAELAKKALAQLDTMVIPA